MHIPVLKKEIIKYLDPKEGMVIVDCTVGLGGHSADILEKIKDKGQLIGIDLDEDVLRLASHRLSSISRGYRLFHGNYKDVDIILDGAGIERIDGALIDLGISSYQIDTQERGFSLKLNGPLDMRMNKDLKIDAAKIVNHYSKDELCDLFRTYGEERFSSRIASRIVNERRKSNITNTHTLAKIITDAVPAKFRYGRIHPATRVFMALRIAVNDEINNLTEGLKKIVPILKKGGRFCVISFHSIEDRIVKRFYQSLSKAGILNILTKKPVIADEAELELNPRARSAKLRVAEKL